MIPALSSYLSAIELLWLCGLAWSIARLALACVAVHRLRTDAIDASALPSPIAMKQATERIAAAVGLQRPARILISRRIASPIIIGWRKPAILIPATLFTSLSAEQAETVLAHECAHLARRDPQTNAIQLAIEALFFFHPAVKWVSGCIRREREYCCDDLALQACGEPLHYAKALAALAEDRTMLQPQFFPGIATGDLSMRVHRLFDNRKALAATTSTRAAIAAAAILTASSLALLSHLAITQVQAASSPVAQTEESAKPAEKPNMACSYYNKENVVLDGECVVTREPEGPFDCAAVSDPGLKQHQPACGWKVKRYLDWEAAQKQHDARP